MDLKKLKIEAEKEIKKAKNLKNLNKVFKKYLGKKGEIAKVFNSLKKLSEAKRKKLGKEANLVKAEIEKMIRKKSKELREKARKVRLKKERIDVTRPGKKVEIGHLHPLTLVQREVLEIFQSMGFSVVLGPDIETEWYNFDALNIPKDHPARDFWDTFWLKPETQKSKVKTQKLLRTHTSPVQIRYMEKHNPPLRIIVPGRCFRHEATDISHDIQFYQLEGLVVDKNISAANFRAIIEEFLKRFFKIKIEIRLRPSFFPFTEPSFEIDVRRGKGKWVEMMGAGMVHPNVFKFSRLNPKNWQGFAFGIGLDRLAMLRYKINDIRLFYSGDLRFLKQF
ncbi:phenylalanine--tRNA ligase subunit alpha [Patescibacteria group bacterium]|nr:phenylalanine--tRNA ligase subunit alpha [Patescibacteria group bacterium]